jgi:hypothetical protein
MQSQVKIGQSRTGFRLVTERARTGEHFWKELDELKHERWSNRWGQRYKTYLWSPVVLARIQAQSLLGRCWNRWCRIFPYRARHYQRTFVRTSRISLSEFPALHFMGRVVHSTTRSASRSSKVVSPTVRRYRLPVAYEKCVIRDMPRD